jgi:hypothetical protein
MMPDKHAFCLLLQVETSDPRLTIEAIDDAAQTAAGMAALRRAILQHLPKDATRLIAVMPVNQARLLTMLHEAYGEAIVDGLRAAGIDMASPNFVRPPADYVPPTQE